MRPWSWCLMVLLSLLTHPASSPSPDGQDARRPRSRNPSTWTVEDVVWFVKDADPQALGPHVELFRKHVCVRGAWPRGRWGGARHGRRAGFRSLGLGEGAVAELSPGGHSGRPAGTTGFSEHSKHFVCFKERFIPSVPSFRPLTEELVFLPVHPAVCAATKYL